VELTQTERRILQLLRDGPKAAPEIAAALGYQGRSGHLKKALDRLGQLDLVSLTISDRQQESEATDHGEGTQSTRYTRYSGRDYLIQSGHF
jgi:hypothetical protein